MKLISENKALSKLKTITKELRAEIAGNYEHRAKSCQTCETPGVCCLDAHFVNVQITRLESKALAQVLSLLPDSKRFEVDDRVERAVEKYGLDDNWSDKTYACPLFEPGIGCLVHNESKPVPCIVHACYENASNLPPDDLQTAAEQRIATLNKLAYGGKPQYLSIPLALRASAAASQNKGNHQS